MVDFVTILFKFYIFMLLFIKSHTRNISGCTGYANIWTPSCIDLNFVAETFDDAENECDVKNGSFLSIHSRVENIAGVLTNYNTNITHLNEAWIGLSLEYGNLKWSDGGNVDFVNWNLQNANHSLNLKEKYCISFNLTDGTWLPQNCLEKKPFFCGIQWSDTTSAPSTIPPSFCKNPCFEGNCIFYPKIFGCSALHTSLNTFDEAESECSLNGGNLLSIPAEGENNDVYTAFDQISFFSSTADAWIGMIVSTNASGCGAYSWIDNTTVAYNNLQPNLTLVANKKYCVSFAFLEKYWKVGDCNEKKLFLCSIPNSTVTTMPFISSTTTPMLTPTNSLTKFTSIANSTTLASSTLNTSNPHTQPQFLPNSTNSLPSDITSTPSFGSEKSFLSTTEILDTSTPSPSTVSSTTASTTTPFVSSTKTTSSSSSLFIEQILIILQLLALILL